MDWTIGHLDHWTIFFGRSFLDLFSFLDFFFWTILSTIREGRGRPLALREGWDTIYSLSVLRHGWEADCYYFGRGGRQLLCREGWFSFLFHIASALIPQKCNYRITFFEKNRFLVHKFRIPLLQITDFELISQITVFHFVSSRNLR